MAGIKNSPRMAESKFDDAFIPYEEKIQNRFLINHTNFLTGEISEENIRKISQWLIYENLDTTKTKKILTLYINSPGGDLYEAFSLIDLMHRSAYPIRTIGYGSILSAAFLIFACGTKKHRYISENCSIMCHQFSQSSEGKYHDIQAAMKENDYCNERMLKILRTATGLSPRFIKSKFLPESDVWFRSKELVEYKVADHIL
jgi:ATP-dependent Clp protease protease subunit